MIPEEYETRDYLLLKYDSTGQLIWEKTFGESDSFANVVSSIDLDDSLNIYICGVSYISDDSTEICIRKYNPTGQTVWTRKYQPSGYREIWDVDIHITKGEGIYLAMTAERPLRRDDWVIMKITPQGVVKWEKEYNNIGQREEILHDSRIDDRENIYLTGEIINEAGNGDFCTMKINSLGIILWISQYNGPENFDDEADNLVIDNEGNVYVAGMSIIHQPGGERAIRVIKYDSLGKQDWVKTKSHPNGDIDLGSMTFENENVYITGTTHPASFDSAYYTTVVKYDSSGDQVWVKNYKDPGANKFNEGTGVEFDNRGNMYIFGITVNAGDPPDYSIFLIKYWGR